MTYTRILASTNELLQILNYSQTPLSLMIQEEDRHSIPIDYSIIQRIQSIAMTLLQNVTFQDNHPIRFQANQLSVAIDTNESIQLLTQIKQAIESLSRNPISSDTES